MIGMIGKLAEDFKIISFNSIINKCTILVNEHLDEIFISRCVALKEHSLTIKFLISKDLKKQ